MQEQKKSKFSLYTKKWSQWHIAPDKALADMGTGLTSAEFFIGNIFSAIFGMGMVFVILIAEFKESKIGTVLSSRGTSLADVVFGLSGGYIGAYVMATLIGAFFSFFIFSGQGSKALFKKHLGLQLEMSFLEPTAGIFFAYALMSAVSQKPEYAFAVLVTLALFWLASRVWYLKASYAGLKALHNNLTPQKFRIAFWGGHCFSFVICNIILPGIAWVLTGIVILTSSKG